MASYVPSPCVVSASGAVVMNIKDKRPLPLKHQQETITQQQSIQANQYMAQNGEQLHTWWASCRIRKIAGWACVRIAGNDFPSPWVSDPDMHHGTCGTHVLRCMPWSLTSGCILSRWRGKRSRHSRRMRNPQFYVSGKRPMVRVCHSSAHTIYREYMKSLSCLFIRLTSTQPLGLV